VRGRKRWESSATTHKISTILKEKTSRGGIVPVERRPPTMEGTKKWRVIEAGVPKFQAGFKGLP